MHTRTITAATAIALSIVLAAIPAGPMIFADTCVLVEHCEDTDAPSSCWYERVCAPEYETHMTSEPNWCLYTYFDKVFIKYSSPGVPSQWYVYHSGTSNANAPAGYDHEPWYVQNDCTIVTYW